ncbi:uncharacterized protein STEHIDRAFT_128952 [Stereum hirsutum FP-91666 SS1]|uniref:uncharacterized protein n=1 Tax=Stereum hirsutum (strain FP-91666) TaxID=721885 RepID=UPI000440D519|nr:uncharacterized protein STEHIDRAFT_128952 [Stereum hirsutum FP-91666 SS1]EIM90092.1 hypothetical protein STEHIDRAFT_128952 [Stereum hirsutum FP-91666 SS1]
MATSGTRGGTARPAPPREVNNLLHTLRGEHFRHEQNLQKSRPHPTLRPSRGSSGPTLPYSLIFGQEESTSRVPEPPAPTTKPAAGPTPRSWALQQHVRDTGPPVYDSAHWREQALSLFFTHCPLSDGSAHSPSTSSDEAHIPSLTNLCLRILLRYYGDEYGAFAEDIVPYLSPHHRRQLLRYTAVHNPLPNSVIYPLFEPDGHADGEVIVVGPQATLRSDFFQTNPPGTPTLTGSATQPDEDETGDTADVWDVTPDDWESSSHPIYSLALLSTSLSVQTLLSFPPCLTHLALIRLSSPIPVHRLPAKCPSLEVLDLSYNDWLTTTTWGEEIVSRIKWSNWRQLRVLGVRECGLDQEALKKVNEGRWEDVEIIS